MTLALVLAISVTASALAGSLARLVGRPLPSWLMAVVLLTGALSGLAIRAAAALPDTHWTWFVQRGTVGIVVVAWAGVIAAALKIPHQPARAIDDDDPRFR